MQCACAILSSAASRLYNILPRYLIKGTIFGEGEVTEHKTCVLIFTTIFFSNGSHSGDNSAEYYHKCTTFSYKVSDFFSEIIKIEFSGPISEKYSNIRLHQSTSRGTLVVPCGRTDRQTDRQINIQADRHDEGNSRCCNFGKASESTWCIHIDQFGTGFDVHNCDSAVVL